ncbi:hypothetical protein SAMN04490196_5653 [Pseudomonas moraviensis]|nr:hypothetical protein SAMN04490196_5653 [Pseudomonas moraviensis]
MKTASQLPPSAGLLWILLPCRVCAGATTGADLVPALPISLAIYKKNGSDRTSYIFGMPPPGNIPPMPRIIFAIPPLAVNFFIIFCICLCCLIKRPMSCT